MNRLPSPKRGKKEYEYFSVRVEKSLWDRVQRARANNGYTWEQVVEFGFLALLDELSVRLEKKKD